MCVSAPKIGATSAPAPVTTSADGLQLGTAALGTRNAGVFGRLALTGGRQAARQSAGAPSGSTATATPGGTLGLPSDYLGQFVYGGIKSSGEV